MPDLDPATTQAIRQATHARGLRVGERIQRLWSGYGDVVRIHLEGAAVPSVVVKHVQPPRRPQHVRGWSTDLSHARKLRSYDVELHFYRGAAARCLDRCRVPAAHRCVGDGERWLFVLEDLDAAGFPDRAGMLDATRLHACLDWLAHFHATFLGHSPDGLWEVGTYWHLATRPDELLAIEDASLRAAAGALDARLGAARFQTLVHGDAKAANFCFSPDGRDVAAVDFQYVGGGCGMKDVAYFLGSCLDARGLESRADALLDHYFRTLRRALGGTAHAAQCPAIEQEWRALYPLAWADFHRFLAGWAPDHAKLNAYSARMTRQALAALADSDP